MVSRLLILCLCNLIFMTGCLSGTKKSVEPLQSEPVTMDEPITNEGESVTLSTFEDESYVETFPERLTRFRKRLTDGEEPERLVYLAEELYVSAPRTELKTRLELGFYLLEYYRKRQELDRAQQLNADVLALLEAMKGGSGFREHQGEQEKVKNLSAEWGEVEP